MRLTKVEYGVHLIESDFDAGLGDNDVSRTIEKRVIFFLQRRSVGDPNRLPKHISFRFTE